MQKTKIQKSEIRDTKNNTKTRLSTSKKTCHSGLNLDAWLPLKIFVHINLV